MPRVSEFFGISVFMYYDDHPAPHFHAVYAGEEAAITIRDLAVMAGQLPSRALGLVVEWASDHQSELAENWRLAEAHQQLRAIAPLH